MLSEDTLEQLARMFPNIPMQVVRSQASRSTSIQAAIEQLLIISSSYPSLDTTNNTGGNHRRPTASGPKIEIPKSPVLIENVSADEWLRDPSIRENLQKQRKQYLAQQAYM